MKELDFDELDRAVNSLMAGVPANESKKSDDAPEADATLTISPTLDENAKPDFAKVDEKVAQSVSTPDPVNKIEVPSRPSVAAPASRRGGRFMDVVHPSSDMKTSSSSVPARSVSRVGATISPSTNSVTASTAESSEPAEVPSPNPVKTEETKPASLATDTSSTGDWPDPLDMANFKEPDTTATSSITKETEPTSRPDVVEDEKEPAVEEVAPETPAPLTSPFLSGAKVEKRPLGGLTPALDDTSSEESMRKDDHDILSQHDPEDQLPADPEKVEVPLPEELRSDLMAIESGAQLQVSENQDVAAVQSAINEIKRDTDETVPSNEPKHEKKEQATPAVTGPASIAQQYKEEPSTGEQSNGAIYDTDTYHQPLAHPAANKSGWMWVVWIALILLLGAGGGAALYFLGLI